MQSSQTKFKTFTLARKAVLKYLSAMALALLVPLFGKPLITSACIEELLGLALQQTSCYS